MMSLHTLATAPRNAYGVAQRDSVLQELLYLGLLERGVYSASRGMMNLNLPHTDDQLAEVLAALTDTLTSLRGV